MSLGPELCDACQRDPEFLFGLAFRLYVGGHHEATLCPDCYGKPLNFGHPYAIFPNPSAEAASPEVVKLPGRP